MKKRFREEQVQLYRTGVKLIRLNSFFCPEKNDKELFYWIKGIDSKSVQTKLKGIKTLLKSGQILGEVKVFITVKNETLIITIKCYDFPFFRISILE